ncbi:MAG: hypothetical protein JOZ62_05295 [Acidobacteriaceae bacterium]|nr:hypothetical protein [Acidobacteriaceae bacterium]
MSHRWFPILLCGVIFGLYLGLPTRSYYWDGVLFSLRIEQAQQHQIPVGELFHANHLLYSPAGYLLYSAALDCGLMLRAISALQVANAVLSSISAYVVFILARRFTGSEKVGWLCAALFAFGATWWKFSTDADAYVISNLLILVAIASLTSARSNVVLCGVCHTTAMLFHELAVFAYAPILLTLALDNRRPVRVRIVRFAAYIIATITCVWVVYWWCYRARFGPRHSGLISWARSYASDSGFTRSLGQLIGANIASCVKLFAGGKLALIEEFSSWPMWVSLTVCVAAVSAGMVLARGHVPRNEPLKTDRKDLTVLWMWLLAPAIFLASWDPGSAFHKLFLWPAIVLLIGAYGLPRLPSRVAAAFVLALVAWNFGAFIWPHAHVSADPVLSLAVEIDKQLPRNATVYYAAFSPDDWYLDYFAPGRKWVQMTSDSGQVVVAGTGPVCFETTALQNLKDPLRPDPRLSWALVNQQHNIRFECVHEPR